MAFLIPVPRPDRAHPEISRHRPGRAGRFALRRLRMAWGRIRRKGGMNFTPAEVPDRLPPVRARRSRGVLVPVIVMALLGASIKVSAQGSREPELKAVLLFNLAQFVEWPATNFPATNAPFVIGVLGHDPLAKILREVVRNEQLQRRAVEVHTYDSVSEVKNCQLLFVGAMWQRRFESVISSLENRPILTVADADGFHHAGGMIRIFSKPDGKLGLRINELAAKSVGLTISAKLLQVAQITRRDD